MSQERLARIAHALLYEGYLLYPYRPSLKNRQRWTFGGVLPREACPIQSDPSSTDRWEIQTQCLIHGSLTTRVRVTVKFLHLILRSVGVLAQPIADWPVDGEPPLHIVDSVRWGNRDYQTWEEAEERQIPTGEPLLGDLLALPVLHPFALPPRRWTEPFRDMVGMIGGALVRTQQELQGSALLAAEAVLPDLYRLTVKVANLTPAPGAGPSARAACLRQALVSTHTTLEVSDGEFVSLTDPPTCWRRAADECRNIGTWPVLIGTGTEKDTLLSSPIILADYPQIAPESPGDFFDGTEIDEMLTLRLLTLTDEEKLAMGSVDAAARELLERTERTAEAALSRLHGRIRADELDDEAPRVVAGDIKIGSRVRLVPQGRADIMDLALAGRIGIVEAVEQDFEGRTHLAVTVEGDPGRELGELRLVAHRFFFSPEEVELLE